MATPTSSSAFSNAMSNGVIAKKQNRTLQVLTQAAPDMTSNEFCDAYFKRFGQTPRDAAGTLYDLKHKGQVIVTRTRPDSISGEMSEAYIVNPNTPNSLRKKLNRSKRMAERCQELHKSIDFLKEQIEVSLRRQKITLSNLTQDEQKRLNDLDIVSALLKQYFP